jgi:hypothetical protein
VQVAAIASIAPVALAAVVFAGGCASKADHPALAGGCQPDAPCTLPPPPTGAGPDTGTHDTSASDTEAGDGGIELAVSGEIRRPADFPVAPLKGTLVTTNADVQATRADGTTITAAPISGTFTLPTVARSVDGAWLRVRANSVIKTLAWVDTSQSIVVGAELPIFDDVLPQVTATRVGLPVAVGGRATIVLRIVDATGAPVAGVTSARSNYLDSTVGYFGPYFDDGVDAVTATSTSTGTKGTLVFLAVDPAVVALGFDVPLVIPAIGARAVSFHVTADAVSYRVFVAQ